MLFEAEIDQAVKEFFSNSGSLICRPRLRVAEIRRGPDDSSQLYFISLLYFLFFFLAFFNALGIGGFVGGVGGIRSGVRE